MKKVPSTKKQEWTTSWGLASLPRGQVSREWKTGMMRRMLLLICTLASPLPPPNYPFLPHQSQPPQKPPFPLSPPPPPPLPPPPAPPLLPPPLPRLSRAAWNSEMAPSGSIYAFPCCAPSPFSELPRKPAAALCTLRSPSRLSVVSRRAHVRGTLDRVGYDKLASMAWDPLCE